MAPLCFIAAYSESVASAPVLSIAEGTGEGPSFGIAKAGTIGSVKLSCST